jgi:hypothetical protein
MRLFNNNHNESYTNTPWVSRAAPQRLKPLAARPSFSSRGIFGRRKLVIFDTENRTTPGDVLPVLFASEGFDVTRVVMASGAFRQRGI